MVEFSVHCQLFTTWLNCFMVEFSGHCQLFTTWLNCFMGEFSGHCQLFTSTSYMIELFYGRIWRTLSII